MPRYFWPISSVHQLPFKNEGHCTRRPPTLNCDTANDDSNNNIEPTWIQVYKDYLKGNTAETNQGKGRHRGTGGSHGEEREDQVEQVECKTRLQNEPGKATHDKKNPETFSISFEDTDKHSDQTWEV